MARLVHLDERPQHGSRVGVAGGDLGGGDLVLDGGAGAAHAVGGRLGHQLHTGRAKNQSDFPTDGCEECRATINWAASLLHAVYFIWDNMEGDSCVDHNIFRSFTMSKVDPILCVRS